MAKAEVNVHMDPEVIRQLKRMAAALERLSPADRAKVDAALDQVDAEFHTRPERITEPARPDVSGEMRTVVGG